MTKHVRKSYRNHRKTTWGAVLVVLVLTALVIALPALAEQTTPTNGVLPASGFQEVLPSVANVGGSNFSCQKAGATSYPSGTPTPSGMKQFQISNPRPGEYPAPGGVTFKIDAPSSGDPKAVFNFSVVGGAAVVYHVGINGGTKTSWYDYVNNNNLKHPAIAGDGVFSDTNVHSTPDSQYKPSKPTFFAASHTTFCYVPLTVEPSCDKPFGPGNGFGGTSDTVQYTAQLVFNGGCKEENVVMFAYSPGGDHLVAQLSPVGDGDTYEVVERVRFTGIDSDAQNPIKLRYDDIGPDYGDGLRDLLMCTSDPRDPDTPFVLPGNGSHEQLLPPPVGTETSCMLESTDSAGTGPNDRTYEAWLFSTIDGGRHG